MNSPRETLVQFWCRLAERLSAGNTLGRALNELASLGTPMQLLSAAVDKGDTLSDALAAQSDVFPPSVVAIFRAGELGGVMDLAAAQIAEAYTEGVIAPSAPFSSEAREQGACLCLLGHMLATGVPILQAVELLVASQPPKAAEMCRVMRDAVIQGRSLAFALAQVLPSVTDIINKAETTGELDRTLVHLGKDLMNSLAPDKLAASDSEDTRKAVNLVFLAAVHDRASDIHLDADGVRFRIDGVLHDRPAIDPAQMIHRLKVMACLDLEQTQFPQDGRILASINNTEYDLRVSTIPTVNGERMVLRILRRGEHVVTLDHAVPDAGKRELMRKILHRPAGLVLCAGPTGSGKTTLLYGMLMDLDAKKQSMFSIEDPVEVRLPGISQVQVNPAAGLTFARAARSIMRQDPDVIMIGEIRDLDTIQTCCQMALTGHLVISQMHTDSSTAAIGRMLDIGVEPFLVSASLAGVVAQRLVRRLCPQCRQPVQIPPQSLPGEAQAIFNATTPTFYAAGQCEQCNHTGYRGRKAIHEILAITQDVRDAIASRASSADIRRIALAAGMRTLRQDGILTAAQGETSLEEVFRVTPA